MKNFRSRPALAIAAAAMLSVAATPAMARGWHRHHNRVDAGDVFAGLLIVGGIAAIAAAASKSNRDKRERDADYRYPEDRDYRDGGDYRNPSPRYGGTPDRGPYADSETYSGSRNDWRNDGSMDGAVDICMGEVERADRQVDTVESVSRDTDGWRVDGRLSSGGRDYSCVVGRDGDVRRVTVDGRSIA